MAVYTLFSQVGGGSVSSDNAGESLGMQFSLTQPGILTGIWFWSPSGATALPDSCCIYQITGTNTGSQVSGTLQSSPSWSGAAGSGWVKATYSNNVTLAASTNYRVVIHHAFGGNFYGATSHFWDTGTGQNGLTSGIITAPKSSAADGANQDAFLAGASIGYPTSSFNAANYWVDVEVTNTGQNVVGVAAQVTVQGGIGVPSASSSFTGTAALVNVQGGTGSVQASALFPANSDFIPGMARPGWATPGDATTGTPANVTGAAAQVTVQGGIGAAGVGATVTGVAALVNVSGGVGTPAGGGNVTGLAALVAVAGGAGTPSAGITITGAAAQVSVQGGAGTPAGGGNVTGAAALVTVQGGAGSLSAGQNITGAAALITVQGGIGAASGSGVTVTGVAAVILARGGTGTPKGSAMVLFTVPYARQLWSVGGARNSSS